MKNLNQRLIDGVEATLNSEFDKAENIFKNALSLFTSYLLYYNLGIVFMKTERYSEAAAAFESALKIKSRDSDILTEAGSAYQALGENDKALSYYERALETAEDKSVVYNNIGTIYFSEENYKEAELYFKKALTENRDYTEARQNLALASTFLDIIS